MEKRQYQSNAIAASVEHFKRKDKDHAICVLPTGAGKSVVISQIVNQVGGNFIVLQPTKEILEQNIKKYRDLGNEASIYSAILNERVRSQVTFATIGSIMSNRKIFKECNQVIIDECHVVNASGGQYEFFLNEIPNLVCLGLTATPYRLKATGRMSIIEFLTRTRPNFFKKVIHVTQQRELLDLGFLSPIKYKRKGEINIEKVLRKGSEYEENSLRRELDRIGIEDLVISEIEEHEDSRKAILVFVEFVEILNKIQAKRPDIKAITGTTEKGEREKILEDFKSGKVKIVANVGVLTTGFDFPGLDTIIVAKAMRSLSLWYQIIGRGQRIAPEKKECLVVDMCGNLSVLGDIQKLIVKENSGKWVVTNGKITTNKAF
jgi:DNA repair protein RadD